MGQYYYLDDTQQPVGPLSLQDVYTLIDREVVGVSTLLCREGGPDWLALPSIHELTGKVAAVSPRREAEASNAKASASKNRRGRWIGSNGTAIIIATMLSLVAIYVTYEVTHQERDAIQAMDHLPGQ